MTDIVSFLAAAGGVLPKRDLTALGARDRQLTAAVRAGLVRRPRRGWYTTFETDDPRYTALRVGGRLTGASALRLLGAWMWRLEPPVTVSVPANSARLRRVPGARVVYDRSSVTARGSYWSVAPGDALRRAVLESTFEEAVALWDWATTSDLFDQSDLDDILTSLPKDARKIVDWADGSSESFPETIARVRLVQAGFTVTTQEPVGCRQRIDLVVDGVVGVEVDGFEFHADTFERDRIKDLRIATEGRTPLRLSYNMVKDFWSSIVRAIEEAVVQHRRGSTRESTGQLAPPRVRRRRRGRRTWALAA